MSARQQSAARVTELVRIAEGARGWGVRHGAKTIYFSSPDGGEIVEMPFPPGELRLKQAEKALERLGLPKTLPKNLAHPDGPPSLPEAVTEPEAPAEVEPVQPDLTCALCAGPKPFVAKNEAGKRIHLARTHGIYSEGARAVRERRQRQREREAADAAVEPAEPQETPQEPEQPEPAHHDLMADVDAAWVLMREQIVTLAASPALEDALDQAEQWQRRADEAARTLAGVRHAIQTMPMVKAFGVIAELVGADQQ